MQDSLAAAKGPRCGLFGTAEPEVRQKRVALLRQNVAHNSPSGGAPLNAQRDLANRWDGHRSFKFVQANFKGEFPTIS
jgi:hypothetical protein